MLAITQNIFQVVYMYADSSKIQGMRNINDELKSPKIWKEGRYMQKIFTNGDIITISNAFSAEAVLTQDGIIKAVGAYESIKRMADKAEIVDLHGHTMLPAFIDAHSHLSSYANSFLQVSLEECSSFDEIAERIKQFIEKNHIQPGTWITAKGYDHNYLAEKRHPSIELLDSCAPQNPLILQHASGHVGVFNRMALAQLGVAVDTPSPEGGRIGVENSRLTGYMEENAFFTYIKKAPMADMQSLMEGYKKAQYSYASHGITSIQEGMTVGQMIPIYQYLQKNNQLYLDLTAYASIQYASDMYNAFPNADGRFDGNFRLGGLKIFLDGSPQGATAWMRTPYLNEEPLYYGYGTMKYEEVLSALEIALRSRRQILAHCNGDAAAQQFLDAVRQVSGKSDFASLRPVMIHAQLLGRDQLEQVKSLGVIPSFFIAHVYHWGDVHVQNFGMERASQISPARSALDHGIPFTFHQDSPVIEPDMLETIWCAVNRVTKSGISLGSEERISVMDALKAVTINAAYQYFEENTKGSIETGKYADFVVLDRNPLKVPLENIREIRVLKTIKRGIEIYSA